MKKYLILFVIAIAGVLSASAISPFAELQPIQAGKHWTAFNVQAGVTVPVHPVVNVGLGAGITEKWDFDVNPLIPIFARCEVSTPISSFKFFCSIDAGYEINTANTSCGALLLNPMVGLKFGKYYAGVGSLIHDWTPKHSGSTAAFNMKVGMSF